MNESNNRRVTDDERRRTVDLLSEAVSVGQLTVSEFEERSAAAYSATHRPELVELLQDLRDNPETDIFGGTPGVSGGELVERPSSSVDNPYGRPGRGVAHRGNGHVSDVVSAAKAQVTGAPGTSSLSISMMGGVDRKHWVVPRTHTTIALMGGNSIDLREAQFTSSEVTIAATAVMGGIDIIVPEGVRVVCNGFALMGGFEIHMDDDATISPAELPADAPVVRVTGFALMGGVDVTVKPRFS